MRFKCLVVILSLGLQLAVQSMQIRPEQNRMNLYRPSDNDQILINPHRLVWFECYRKTALQSIAMMYSGSGG